MPLRNDIIIKCEKKFKFAIDKFNDSKKTLIM